MEYFIQAHSGIQSPLVSPWPIVQIPSFRNQEQLQFYSCSRPCGGLAANLLSHSGPGGWQDHCVTRVCWLLSEGQRSTFGFSFSFWGVTGVSLDPYLTFFGISLGSQWNLFGISLESLWNLVGISFESFWNLVAISLESRWNLIGISLESHWNLFGISLESLWSALESRWLKVPDCSFFCWSFFQTCCCLIWVIGYE